MKQEVIVIFLIACAFAVAMVPRERICDSDCYITNVDASYGGATHDAYIWRECSIRTHLESHCCV